MGRTKYEQITVVVLRPIRTQDGSAAIGDIIELDEPDANFLHNCKKVSKDEAVIAKAQEKAKKAPAKK